jgi:nucleoid DNA-binding protein
MGALTKADLAEMLFDELGLNKREAKEIVEMFYAEISSALENNDQVKISGFGNFDLRDKKSGLAEIPRLEKKYLFLRAELSHLSQDRNLKHELRLMLEPSNNNELPAIPGKRYFTIGEVSELCGVKPHVLRYWEQEFPRLSPVKRRGNRRYYQRQDVVLD